MRKYGFLLIGAVFLCSLFGCASPRHYTAEIMGLGYVKRIVVLPFENHTDVKHAEERFQDAATTEILHRGLFDIIEKGESQRFFREELVRKQQDSLDYATARKLGEELQVEAYLAGAVEDFSEKQNGSYSYPVVAATLRLVDVMTGQIVWQASDSQSGYRTLDRLFGFVSDDSNKICFRLVERLLETLEEQ